VRQPGAHERLHALHDAPRGFVMPNAWDGASAVLLRQAGFPALGTSSLAIAFALGRHDGVAAVSREMACANGTLLAAVSGLPIA
jgi:2-methylisocitrate lyase-like PEP mutase family enzyme